MGQDAEATIIAASARRFAELMHFVPESTHGERAIPGSSSGSGAR
jgi:hypothetical protein